MLRTVGPESGWTGRPTAGCGPPPTSHSLRVCGAGRGVPEPPGPGTGGGLAGSEGSPSPAGAAAGGRGRSPERAARGEGRPPPAWPPGRPSWQARPSFPGRLLRALAVRSCVCFAEWTASRCPGSERSRGRWKFLWIKHGAEARWLFGLAALPPHPAPVRTPRRGVHSCHAPGPSSARPLLAQSRAAGTPSPGREEAAG